MDAYFRQELKRRRETVRKRLSANTANDTGDVLVLFSQPVQYRNSDVEHSYRQHSDFLYLTGFEEPDCALVLRGGAAGTEQDPATVLFLRPRNRQRETWDGRRLGLERATEVLDVDRAVSIDELKSKLPDFLEGRERVHFLLGENPEWDRLIIETLSNMRRDRKRRGGVPSALVDARDTLHEMRLFKSEYEQQAMAEVGQLSAQAHRAAMTACQPGMKEWQLQDVVESVFRAAGARKVAYESIVGSGENATILHYRENDRTMQSGDLVLIDAGAEKNHLAADITRTFPVNGRFSAPQRRIYDIVLRAQLSAIDKCIVGNTLEDVHEAATAVIREGLVQAGLLDDTLPDEQQKKRVSTFFMHRTSHFLGMDVHDVGRYFDADGPRKLAEGMVVTVEPGLYFSSDDDTVDAEYRGIGVRIEDDVLVLESGPSVLSLGAPKTIEEIEAAFEGK